MVVENGATLPITHIGHLSSTPSLHLLDVLAMPHLTKNLLSISKLTTDFPFSVHFTNFIFIIQNHNTGKVVATGRHKQGLYVLDHINSTFVSP